MEILNVNVVKLKIYKNILNNKFREIRKNNIKEYLYYILSSTIIYWLVSFFKKFLLYQFLNVFTSKRL